MLFIFIGEKCMLVYLSAPKPKGWKVKLERAHFSKVQSGKITMCKGQLTKYRISANSFRRNYSFLKLALSTVTFGDSTQKCGEYSREETIRGNTVHIT